MERRTRRCFTLAYCNYYAGCLEGIFLTRFLDEFDRMPSPSEIIIIKEAIYLKFESFKHIVIPIAQDLFDEYDAKGWPQPKG